MGEFNFRISFAVSVISTLKLFQLSWYLARREGPESSITLHQTVPPNDVRLLALDGGRVRGLSTLMILQQLMETTNPNSPPKLCDHFDFISGIGTVGKSLQRLPLDCTF